MFEVRNKYCFMAIVIWILILSCSKLWKLKKKDAIFLRDQDEELLPFIPANKSDFTCDDFFIGSKVDHFNFSEEYHKSLPVYSKLLTKWSYSGDGHSAMFPAEYKVLHFLSTQEIYRSYCETGFNYGHSSFSALTAKNDSKVLSFDIGYHNYTITIMSIFQSMFKNRFTPVIGDSSFALPKFINKNPDYRCDNFFIDGSHSYKIGFSDLQNFAKMAKDENIVVFDDYPTLSNEFGNELGRAWNQAIKEGWLQELMRCTRKSDRIRGFCVGRFIKQPPTVPKKP